MKVYFNHGALYMAQYGNLRLFIIFTIIYIQAKIIFLLSYNNKSYLETGIVYANLHQVFRKLLIGYIDTLIRSWQCWSESIKHFVYPCYCIHLRLIDTFPQKKLWVTKGEYYTKVAHCLYKKYSYSHLKF